MMIFIMALLLLVGNVYATTRYVSTSGSDSNSCATSTSGGSSAKRNLNGSSGAIACMSGGDTLLLQNGTYNEQISDTGDHAPNTTAPPSGTSWSAPTIIKAENFRGATLNKPSADPNFELVIMIAQQNRQYISIEDLVIDGRGAGSTCVWLGPASHLQMKGNIVKNCGRNGIFASTNDDETIGEDIRLINNEIFDVAVTSLTEPGGHSIYYTTDNGLIQGNYIYGCEWYGIHVTSEHGGITNNIIENNRVYGCRAAGIISQGSNTIIRNNLVENSCIGIFLNGSTTQVYNNTIFDHRAEGCNDSYGILVTSGGSGKDVRNNLILQQESNFNFYIYSTSSLPNLENNLCDHAGENCQLFVADYTTVVVNGIVTTTSTPVANDLRLKSGSPAINAGGNLGSAVPVDRLGVSRPQGGAFDIGAYEFVSGGDGTFPAVSVTAPLFGAVLTGTAVTISANASDNVGVVGVQFKLSGANIGAEDTSAPYSIVFNSTTVSNGSYSITAVARDNAGNTTISNGVNVTVSNGDGTFPTVSVTAPAQSATVSGTITMSATASDNVGVVDVQFKVDGGNVNTPDVGPSYDRAWDTTLYSNGSHTVTAVARDAAGNVTVSNGVTVTVNNGGGGGGGSVTALARRRMFMRY